jgi:transposase InsO family protein
MDIHKNARTTLHSRMLIVQRLTEGWTVPAVAAALGITAKTVRKWRDRHASEGAKGLADRTSRPHQSPTRLASSVEDEIEQLRRQRLSSPAIARRLQRPLSTIGVALRRRGLGRLAALDPKPPIIRYEREKPGEMIHIDIKKLGRIDGIGHRITGDRTGQSNRRAVGRGLGWEFLHVAIDDASRLAYTELLPDERSHSAVAFTARAIDWFAKHGVTVERIMSDNGSAYKSFAFRDLLAERSIKHKRTRPYTPRTNGKAERFIQTSLREWAYAQPFQTSADRAAAMLPWITEYNTSRPHTALNGLSPRARLANWTTQTVAKPRDTSDTEPRFVAMSGVKPREATAEGGLGLTPDRATQAKSVIGGDNLLGSNI